MNAVAATLAVATVGALVPWSSLAADGAIARYDDAIVSAQVMEHCHVVISGHISEDEMRATGEAAFQVLWDNLNRQDRASREQNGRLADFLLKKRTEMDIREGMRLVAEKGCRVLTPHAREVLEAYRQP